MSQAHPLDETDKCKICLDVYSEPVSTPCGHYMCKDCFKMMMRAEATSRDGVHRCPICRKAILQNAGQWVCGYDSAGRTYFYNTQSGVQTFERPQESEAHWSDEIEYDATGRPYQFNRLTGEVAYMTPKAAAKHERQRRRQRQQRR